MDGQNLPEHAPRTHNNERSVGKEDAYSEVQLPRYCNLEPVDRSS